MSDILAWLPLIGAIIVLGSFVGTLISTVAVHTTRRAVAELCPRSRFAVLWVLCALPFLMAMGFLTIAFAPSAFDALGLAPDHCGHHLDHAFHLCFLHGSPPITILPAVAAVVLMGAAVYGLAGEMRGVFKAASWVRQLKRIAQYDESVGAWLVQSPGIAFTAGLVRPAVFMSARELSGLSSVQHAAVVSHERAHVNRRDALMKSLARVLASVQLPSVRRELMEGLDLAAEQACDEFAASTVGDRMAVAEAIVAAARWEARLPAQTLGFGRHSVEERVHWMLMNEPPPTLPHAFIAAMLAVGATALLRTYEELHHALESVLLYVI